tara:strand:- start:1065 stop:1820 length:756 start_codon:yes stop_codon:yes gene_type:complete
MEIVLVMNDFQIPFHDEGAIACVEEVMVDLQPDVLVYLGDIFDFPGLSTKFRRSPDQRYNLKRELVTGAEIFLRHQRLVPHARRIYVEGNHEARLRNYVIDLADELAAFTDTNGALSLPKLLRLDEAGIEYVGPYGAAWEHESFVFKHGDRATKNTSSAELVAEGTSGISGHTHRGGSTFNTTRSGAHVWYENFCLCHARGWKQPPSHVNSGIPNWQQGFSVVYFDGGMFNVYPVVITGGKCIFGGKKYGS